MGIDVLVEESAAVIEPIQDKVTVRIIEPAVEVNILDDVVNLNVVEDSVDLSIINDKIDIAITEQPVQILVFEGAGSDAPVIIAPEDEVYDIEVDTSIAGVTYVGQAAPGTAGASPLWRIKRITDTATGSSVDWANGNADFTNVWDNHLSYSYGP